MEEEGGVSHHHMELKGGKLQENLAQEERVTLVLLIDPKLKRPPC